MIPNDYGGEDCIMLSISRVKADIADYQFKQTKKAEPILTLKKLGD